VSRSLAAEIGEIARIAAGFAQRHDVPVAELLPYQRRKAETLTLIAEQQDDDAAREVASAAWRRVRELEASW
jgi:antitoxin (DNA-binding transcriptional repressor) of toxin-antitoxin stability system